MTMLMEKGWRHILEEECNKPYIAELKEFLSEEQAGGMEVFPPMQNVFHALLYTPFEKVKVVIMGQDPYHGPNQAHGLSFSVQEGVAIPPSLKNIYKEIESDLGYPMPTHGCLTGWAKQGVLLLNATLTVRRGEPKSHYGRGWERFTDAIIEKLSKREDPVVFLLWGKSAQEKGERVLQEHQGKHAVLKAAHPSPFSATNFFGCRHFSKANKFLQDWGKTPIDWRIV